MEKQTHRAWKNEELPTIMLEPKKERKMVTLHIEEYGDIVLEMDYQNAPISAANFVSLAKKGFYNGLTFHRIIKGFMIQGGDPLGNGTGGPGYSIKGEFSVNGVKNRLSHQRGVISMARSASFDSAGSQFFICDADDSFLDGQYAAFGKVVKGMEVVDKIAKQPKSRSDRPLSPIVISSVSVTDEEDRPFDKIPG